MLTQRFAPRSILKRTQWARLFGTVSSPKKEHLIVCGVGWGGYRIIKDIDKSKYDVTVVAPRNHMLFTPLLASTTVGTLEFRSITEPVRAAIPQLKDFHLAECVGLSPSHKTIQCRGVMDGGPFELKYDKLVLAIGASANTFGIDGVKEYTFFLKELADAQNIRKRILQNAARAGIPGVPDEDRRRWLHFVVVGGGPTGVEFAGELHDFLKDDFMRLFPKLKPYVKVTLVEANEILSSFDKDLKAYAEQRLLKQDVEIRKEIVDKVTDKDLVLKNGERLPYGLIVWSTGVGPRSVVSGYNLELGPNNRIMTDENLLCVGQEDVYAIGDCAMIEGRPALPPIAQVAEKEGKYVAECLNSLDPDSDGRTGVNPFTYKHFGMMAYLGEYKALLQVNVPAEKSAGMRGWSSWFAWRGTYATKLGMWKNRIQVPIDWMKTFIVGRDITLPDAVDPHVRRRVKT